jgi:integrase
MITYYLRAANKSLEWADVYANFQFSSTDRYRKSTGLRIKMSHWDPVKMRMKPNTPGSMEINLLLAKFEERKAELQYTLKIAKKTADTVMVDEFIFGKQHHSVKTNQKQNLESNLEDYKEKMQSTISKNSIKSYVSSFNQVRKYAKFHGLKFDYALFDESFEHQFVDYLINEQNISNNTIGKYFMSIKIFLKKMEKSGFVINPVYKDYKILSAPVDFVYLTSKELDSLLELDLSSRPHLEPVRDMFVFQCGCGLRYGDLGRITWDDIYSNRIEITTEKTKQILRIPLNKYTSWVIDRNQGKPELMHPTANQIQNRYLKELGAMMGMFSKHKVVKFFGSKRTEDRKAKWELITTHTARRTFVILALERGMRPEVVMKITGHTKLSTLQRYIKISDNVVEDEMMRAFG